MTCSHIWITNNSSYLQYKEFTVYNDHHALNSLLNITEPSGRLTRWRLRLDECSFESKYKKCANNNHAVALFRLLTEYPTVDDYDEDIPAFHLDDENDWLDISR